MSLIYTAPSPSAGLAGKKHGLFIGSKADAKSRSILKRLGVTHVLNVTPEKEACIQSGVPNYFEGETGANRITYRRVPVYDSSTSDLLSQADSIVGFISSGLHHGSVLVHCKLGMSRSTTCVIFFLMRKLGMTFDRALALCRQRRPDVNPIPAFVMQLRRYEMKCRKLGVISDHSDASKKRKVPAGPAIGPARGPVQGPMAGPAIGPSAGRQIGPTIEDQNPENGPQTKKARTIGPDMPSSTQGSNDIGPANAVSAIIGPSIAPQIKAEKSETQQAPMVGSAKGPTIGPSTGALTEHLGPDDGTQTKKDEAE